MSRKFDCKISINMESYPSYPQEIFHSSHVNEMHILTVHTKRMYALSKPNYSLNSRKLLSQY